MTSWVGCALGTFCALAFACANQLLFSTSFHGVQRQIGAISVLPYWDGFRHLSRSQMRLSRPLRVIQRGLFRPAGAKLEVSPSQASHLRELSHCLLGLVSCIAWLCGESTPTDHWFDFWFLISGNFQHLFFETNHLILSVRSQDSLLPFVLLAARLPGELPSGFPQPDAETWSMSVRKQKNPKMSEAVTRLCSPICSKLCA